MTKDNLCTIHDDYQETVMYVLRDCEEAKMFWNNLISQYVGANYLDFDCIDGSTITSKLLISAHYITIRMCSLELMFMSFGIL